MKLFQTLINTSKALFNQNLSSLFNNKRFQTASLLLLAALAALSLLLNDAFETDNTAIAAINQPQNDNNTAISLPRLPNLDEALATIEQHIGTTITGSLKNGDSLDVALRRAQVPRAARLQIIDGLASCLDPKKLKAKDSFTVLLDDDENLLHCTYEINELEAYRITAGPDGSSTTEKMEIEVETRRIQIHGTINDSLFASFNSQGERAELVYAFADIFASRVDFNTEIYQGDQYWLEVEKIYKDNQFIKYGNILYAALDSPEAERQLTAYYYKTEDGRASYYNEQGEELLAAFIRSPLPIGRLTSKFSYRRKHPILGIVRPHLGIDLAAPQGTPIMAAADGKVVFVGPKGGFGKYIVLQHSGGYRTHYGHLSRFRKGLKKGVSVKQKETIGYVGSTGLSTGPHLDYRMEQHGVFKNPFAVKASPKSILKGQDLASFNETRLPFDTKFAVLREESFREAIGPVTFYPRKTKTRI